MQEHLFDADLHQKFHQYIGRLLARLRDVSMRDGQQCWDANLWTNTQTLDVIKAYRVYADNVRLYTGYDVPPIEVSGGGEYLQPARFLGENPFDNLETRKEAGQSLRMQSLYRGNNGFGFLPATDEIQYYAILQTSALGNGVLRCFDMMNDADNLTTAMRSVCKVRQRQKEYGVSDKDLLTAEWAIAYISSPSHGEAAFTMAEYANLAVSYCQKFLQIACTDFAYERSEVFEMMAITLKDYASQCVDGTQTRLLMRIIRMAMNEAGFAQIPLNMHTHGQKPELLYHLLQESVSIVDVAIGSLSKGPSHTNMRDLMVYACRQNGFDTEIYQHHPILKALADLENLIHHMSLIHSPHRMPLDVISAEEIASHKIASGAASALWALINKRWASQIQPSLPQKGAFQDGKKAKTDLFLKTLQHLYDPKNNTGIWLDAGQFNTVTPGSTIAYDQALLKALADYIGRILPIGQHNQAYKNVVMGRYGKNQGLDKGLGDQNLRKAYFLEAGLDFLQNQTLDISEKFYHHLLAIAEIPELSQIDDKFSIHKEAIFRRGNLQALQDYVQKTTLPQALKDKFMFHTCPVPFSKNEKGLDKGREQVSLLEQEGLCFSTMKCGYALCERDKAALLIMILYTTDKAYEIGKNVLRKKYHSDLKILEQEPERYGDIAYYLQDELPKAAAYLAKIQTLEEVMRHEPHLSTIKLERTKQGLGQLQQKFISHLRQMLVALKKQGYGYHGIYHAFDMGRAKQAIRVLIYQEADHLLPYFKQTPPIFWESAFFKRSA